MGEVHVRFGRLYALFNEQGPAPEEMMAGFVAHDLATFSQSYPKPDLSHLPPERVLECGELWATTAGAARLARHAGRYQVSKTAVSRSRHEAEKTLAPARQCL
jgi:hypothetical protein